MTRRTSYRFACAALAWLTLITQYGLIVIGGKYGGFWVSNLIFFGYFTILTNILAALAFTAPFLKQTRPLYRFFMRQEVRAAIALYILIVAIVYHAMLAAVHNPTGLNAITNISLHYILPVLYIMDWLAVSPKGKMAFKTLPLWTVYPVIYGGFTIVQGLISGFYPYPFLDISQRGWAAVIITMLIFCAVYIIGGAGFMVLGRILSRRHKE